ncbi:MAG: hypothetical protein JSW11_07195 [Candidatus Heimdallarchaeota archaeon]|nr:MAG: hypothetical protein JSW11_07195 [Candidatus Heimdallarchaeota archaeon]
MPHIVLNGKITIDNIFANLKPIFVNHDTGIIKTTTQFISEDKNAILVDSLSIESKDKYRFFTLINKSSDGIVIRIYPGSEIEKTHGVKKILVEIAKQILSTNPNLTIGKTNLTKYLEK